MNRIESLKSQASLATVEQRLHEIATSPDIALTLTDIQALKTLGLNHRKSSPNTFNLRIRIPAGQLTTDQARAIAHIASRYSSENISLTARCQLQLRNFSRADLLDIFQQLALANLITTNTLMDSVRNVLTHPLHNLTNHDIFDVTPTLTAFEKLVNTQTHWRNLPRKINLYISSTTLNDPLAYLQDIALLPATTTSSNQPQHGFTLYIAGRASCQTLHKAQPTNIFLSPQNAPTLLKHLINLYQQIGPRKKRTLCRISDWIQTFPIDQLKITLQNKCDFDLFTPHTPAISSNNTPQIFGPIPQSSTDHHTLGLYVPNSQISPSQLLSLADITDQYAQSSFRITPQQSIIIPHIRKDNLTSALAHPLLNTITPSPTPFQTCSLSCSGLPHCGLSLIDTKQHHRQTIARIQSLLPNKTTNLPIISFSGCKAGCGRHAAADIAIVGRQIKHNNQIIEAADIYIPEKQPTSNQRLLVKIFEQIPCDQIADTILPLIQHRTPTTHQYLTQAATSSTGTSQLPATPTTN